MLYHKLNKINNQNKIQNINNDINKNRKDNRAETKCYKNIKYLNMANLLSIKKLINNKRNS